MKEFVGGCCVLLFLSTSAFAQREKSTLLPPSQAKTVTDQCSRPGPSKFTDTWQPSKEELQEMESGFGEIRKLTVLDCCLTGVQIKDPQSYYMQYAGIVLDGKKLIYINAIPGEPGDFWREQAVVICDGGNAWGVLYDPKTKKFYSLAINGVA